MLRFFDSRPFVTAHKRSLGQGNISTPVCQSFCSQGSLYEFTSCQAAWSHVPSGVSLSAGLCLGGLCPEGLCPGRGSLSAGVSVRETPRTVMSGWYASYWNDFLFYINPFILSTCS